MSDDRKTDKELKSAVRALAMLHGEDPETIWTAMQANSPLARLWRKLLGGPTPRATKKGRKAATPKNWFRFKLCELAMRLTSHEKAEIRAAFTKCVNQTPGCQEKFENTYAIAAWFGDGKLAAGTRSSEKYRKTHERAPPEWVVPPNSHIALASLFVDNPLAAPNCAKASDK